ncbi:MAG: hypothetical protein VX798_01365 [Bacteroidota bacterium]|nr:hypothetical protein [Bacteroidota bacterium]
MQQVPITIGIEPCCANLREEQEDSVLAQRYRLSLLLKALFIGVCGLDEKHVKLFFTETGLWPSKIKKFFTEI